MKEILNSTSSIRYEMNYFSYIFLYSRHSIFINLKVLKLPLQELVQKVRKWQFNCTAITHNYSSAGRTFMSYWRQRSRSLRWPLGTNIVGCYDLTKTCDR